MNIYSLNPQWLKRNALEAIIDILKVRKVYCFIPSYDSNGLNKIETLLIWDGTNLDDFFKKCVYDFVNILSEPLFFNGDYIGERIVKNMFSESLGLNPIYNIENLNDPNILILWTPDVQKQLKGGITSMFRNYSMNILNKYGSIDYMERICFYCFDSFLSCSYIFRKKMTMEGKFVYIPSKAVIANRYDKYDSKLGTFKWVDYSYDPLLSYMFQKTTIILDGISLQERFLTTEGIKEYEEKSIIGYIEFVNSKWAGYEPDDSLFVKACKAEEEYIINNGGDWIYD